ncbi:hypothetical protein AURDEDRAFT_186134 [Auricularia subglabra TFB-10046 SS5]|nr:hypothetical protein AURDEDRAFT_186134 [Auricularia subglabra TFB-10046 SS5]
MHVPNRKRGRSDEPPSLPDRQPKHRRRDTSSDPSDRVDPPPQPPFGPSVQGMLASDDQVDVFQATPAPGPSAGQSMDSRPVPSATGAVVPPSTPEGHPPPYSFTTTTIFKEGDDATSLSFQALAEFRTLIDSEVYAPGTGLYVILRATQKDLQKTPNEYFLDKPVEHFHAVLQHDQALSADLQRLTDLLKKFAFTDSIPFYNSIAYHKKQSAILVRHAWDTPLLGQTDIKLVKTLQASVAAGPAASRDYSNTVTKLQSSGTGKTRSTHETGKYVFSFPVCLLEGIGGAAFPRPDISIRDLMIKPAGTLAEDMMYRMRYSHIIRLLVVFAVQILDAQTWPVDEEWPRAYLTITNVWNFYLRDHRDTLYNLVALRVEDLEQSFRKTSPQDSINHPWLNVDSAKTKHALRVLHDVLRGTTTMGARTFEGDELLPETHQYRLSESEMKDVQVTVDGLIGRWETFTKTDMSAFWPTTEVGLFVLIYFDEAHVLLPKGGPVTRPARTQYDHLLSVLNDLLQHIFAVFLSTSSQLRNFAPPQALAPSERHAKSEYVQPPITECPFDCFARNISLTTLKLEELSAIEFMARFGRPLFRTMLNANADEVDEEARAKLVMRLVVAKLTGLDLRDVANYRRYSEIARLAVLDVRMCLDYETRKFLSVEMEADLVAFHLRLAYSVPGDRRYMYSGYSSEPLIAEAAACVMRAWMWHWSDASLVWNPLDELAARMKESLLDRGERGEVVGRYILIHAYDLAMMLLHNGTVGGWSFSAGCPLNTFIKGLFCQPTADEVLDCYPDNIAASASESFSTAFKFAYVRFTHFARLIDTSGLTTVGLAAAFIRGMAFIAKAGQILVDLIIPVLIDCRKPVSPENMTAILVQIKRRVRAGTAAKYDYTAEELGLFKDSDPKPKKTATKEQVAIRSRPYITLLLELGVKPVETPSAMSAKAKGKATTKKTPTTAKAKSTPKTKSTTTKTISKAAGKALAKTTTKSQPKAGPSKAKAQPSDVGATAASGSAGSSSGAAASGPAMATRGRTKRQAGQTSKATIGVAPQRKSPRFDTDLPHPRYNIRVYGCSEAIYNVIKADDRENIERILLSKVTMFEEHPRKDTILDVWRMKPVWGRPISYEWLEKQPVVEDEPVKPNVDIEEYVGHDAEDVEMAN